MKKILTTIILTIFFFSCTETKKENIDIYIDKNLTLLMEKIVKIYEEKNNNIKINLYTDKPVSLNNFEILISSDKNIFSDVKKSEQISKKEESKNPNENFESTFFTTDNVVIIGRKKLNSLNELLYSNIAVSNYDDGVGKYFMDSLANTELFNEISKKIQYFDDSISAMQAVELYEVDYAVINTLLLDNVKNSIICYIFPKTEENKDAISYNLYLKKESSSQVQNFYNFLKSSKVENIINRNKEVS